MVSTTTKKCSRCGEFKPLDSFAKNKNGKDGLMAACKPCKSADRARYRQKPGYAEQHRASNLLYRQRNKEKIAQDKIEWNNANPEKRRAHRKVWKRRKSGKIKPPTHCESCGTETFTEASHTDYNQPLLVTWLCIPCHRKADAEHARQRATKGDRE